MTGVDDGPSDDEAARLAEWLRLEGLPADFEIGIHPSDEMLPGVAVAAVARQGRERLGYLRSGQEALVVLQGALAAFGRSLREPTRVLELASGYGRVTRHLLEHTGRERLTACELVPEAVAHVASRFGVACLPSRSDPSAMTWPHRFDVIFVGSLFSHLPRPRFEGWLAQLRRAVADDGLLILSTHGPWMPQAPADDGRGFAFSSTSESLSLDGHEYGTSFVAPDEVARMARAAGWRDVAWLERELWSLQDVFVLSPAPLRPVAPWKAAPVLDGGIDGLEAAASGVPGAAGASGASGRHSGPRELWLHGWVDCHDADQPVVRASLHLGRHGSGSAALHAPQREERPPPRPVRRVVSEWHHHAALPPGFTGRSTIALVAETATQRRCVDVRTLDLDRLVFLDGEPA